MTNVVVLRGRLTRPASMKVLPSGDRLTAFDLTVPAADGGRAEPVPVSWFGAAAWFDEVEPGDELVVVGRVHRRFFRGASGLQSRTEVVVDAAAPARQASRAAAIVRRAVDAAVGTPGGRRRAAPTFE